MLAATISARLARGGALLFMNCRCAGMSFMRVIIRERTIVRKCPDVWSTAVGAIYPITDPALCPYARSLRTACIREGGLVEPKFHRNQTALSHRDRWSKTWMPGSSPGMTKRRAGAAVIGAMDEPQSPAPPT